MKKFTILTFALILAACGGGTGTSTGSAVRESVTNDAIESNKKFTSMASAVYISRDKARTVLSRSGSIIIDGKEYEMHRIDDARLHTTPLTDAYNDIDAGADLVFEVDSNGEIKKITLSGVKQYVHPNPDWTEDNNKEKYLNGWTADREGQTGNFKAENVAFVGTDEEIAINSMTLGYESLSNKYKKDNKLDLKYSDFGNINFISGDIEGEEEENDQPEKHYFAGGYQILKVNPENIDKDMTFKGIVNANVRVHKSYADYDGPVPLDLIDENAKLVFNTSKKTSTLNMKFNDWYDVKADMDKNGNLSGLLFIDRIYDDNGNAIGYKDINNRYRFRYDLNPVTGSTDSDGNYKSQAQREYVEGQGSDEYGKDSVIRTGFVEYYGAAGSPSEAVGSIRYSEESGGEQFFDEQANIDRNARIDFVAGFGAEKQN